MFNTTVMTFSNMTNLGLSGQFVPTQNQLNVYAMSHWEADFTLDSADINLLTAESNFRWEQVTMLCCCFEPECNFMDKQSACICDPVGNYIHSGPQSTSSGGKHYFSFSCPLVSRFGACSSLRVTINLFAVYSNFWSYISLISI